MGIQLSKNVWELIPGEALEQSHPGEVYDKHTAERCLSSWAGPPAEENKRSNKLRGDWSLHPQQSKYLCIFIYFPSYEIEGNREGQAWNLLVVKPEKI